MMPTKKQSARLIFTLSCREKYKYCCNTEDLIKSATNTTKLSELNEYDPIVIAGGEPLLKPRHTIGFCKAIKKNCGNPKLFLYTTQITLSVFTLRRVIEVVDGITFGLHEDLSLEEQDSITTIQSIIPIFYGMNKTFRLKCVQSQQGRVKNRLEKRFWDKIEYFDPAKKYKVPEKHLLIWRNGK